MTQQELDALKALAEASVNASATRDEARHVSFLTDAEEEFLSAVETAVPALVAEVERLTARVAELEAANADMYRTMEDACARAEQAVRTLAVVRYSAAAAMDGEHP